MFALREEALARNDLETVRKMDEKLKEMEECMDKATQIVESLLEKYKEGAALSDNKRNASPDIIDCSANRFQRGMVIEHENRFIGSVLRRLIKLFF